MAPIASVKWGGFDQGRLEITAEATRLQRSDIALSR